MSEIRFGTDGWRGIIAEDVTFANVRLVARAIARRVLAEASEPLMCHVLVGYDTRFLSREFAEAAAKAMAGEGLQVSLTSAFAPTPAFSYAVVRLGAAGAVVITASHNPPQYSGVKFKSSFGGSAPIAFTRGVEEEIRCLQTEAAKFEIRNLRPELRSRDSKFEIWDAGFVAKATRSEWVRAIPSKKRAKASSTRSPSIGKVLANSWRRRWRTEAGAQSRRTRRPSM